METFKRSAKKIIITIAGFVVLIGGIIMLVAPGPGLVFIIMGLAILATEYVWAQKIHNKAKDHYHTVKQKTLDKIRGAKTDKL